MDDFIQQFLNINLLDIFFVVIFYNVFQCSIKGFSLSLIFFEIVFVHHNYNYFSS